MNDKTAAGNAGFMSAGNKDGVAMAVVVALVFLVYAITLTSNYGMLDDYYFLQNGIDGSNGTVELLVGAGRPLNGWLLHAGFSAAASIEHLAALRFVTLAGIALLGCTLYAFARTRQLTAAASLTMATAVVLLPSFQVYAVWAQHFTTPFAGVLGLLAAHLVAPSRPGAPTSARAIVLATLLLAIALLIYQPTAMFFCTGILISVLASPEPRRDWPLAHAVSAGAVFGAALAIGFVALKLGQRLYPSGSSRYGLLNDPIGKAEWFVQEPLRNALSLYAVPGNNPLAIGCALAVFCGLCFYFIRRKPHAAIYAITLSALCLLGAYLPNLATAENWASYRSIGALAASVVVLVATLVVDPLASYVSRLKSTARQRAAGKVGKLAGMTLLVCVAVAAQGTVSNALVLPNVAELDNLSSQLKSADTDSIGRILVHPSAWTDSAARPLAYDEFGIPSSVKSYYAGAIVDLVRKSLNVLNGAEIVVVEKKDAPAGAAGVGPALIVDFAQLAASGRFKSVRSPALSAQGIMLENITDHNWTKGIWTNRERAAEYSFVYRRSQNGLALKPGDQVTLAKSGERVVVRVDSGGDYRNVLLDGPPLVAEDGHPALVTVAKRVQTAK